MSYENDEHNTNCTIIEDHDVLTFFKEKIHVLITTGSSMKFWRFLHFAVRFFRDS